MPQQLDNFLVRHEGCDVVVEVASSDLVVLRVVGVDAIAGDEHIKIALKGIDRRRTDASMGIDSCNNESEGLAGREELIQVGAKEGAIALLDDDDIGGKAVQLWQDLTAVSPSDRDPYAALAHGNEGVGEIGREFLPDPVDRLGVCSKCGDELIG